MRKFLLSFLLAALLLPALALVSWILPTRLSKKSNPERPADSSGICCVTTASSWMN